MIKLDNVSKKFATGTFGLTDVSLNVEKGEFVFLVGPTGSGKTTIFKLLIRDILPTQGHILINEVDILKLPKNKVSNIRKKIGVIFQDLKLLFDRTVFENVYLPLDVAGIKQEEATRIVNDILAQVELLSHKEKFPLQLSGGEKQRVAIARALALSPEIILADEPTSDLDSATSLEIVKILTEINKKGTTVIMATHNEGIIKNSGKRVIRIEKGEIVNPEKPKDEKHKKEDSKKEEKEATFAKSFSEPKEEKE